MTGRDCDTAGHDERRCLFCRIDAAGGVAFGCFIAGALFASLAWLAL